MNKSIMSINDLPPNFRQRLLARRIERTEQEAALARFEAMELQEEVARLRAANSELLNQVYVAMGCPVRLALPEVTA